MCINLIAKRGAPVGVFVVAVLPEMRWSPAVDRITDELFGGQNEGEQNEKHHRKTMTQSINAVVIAKILEYRDAVEAKRLEYFLPRTHSSCNSVLVHL